MKRPKYPRECLSFAHSWSSPALFSSFLQFCRCFQYPWYRALCSVKLIEELTAVVRTRREDLRILLKEVLWCHWMTVPSMKGSRKQWTLESASFEVSPLMSSRASSASLSRHTTGLGVSRASLGSNRSVSREGHELTRQRSTIEDALTSPDASSPASSPTASPPPSHKGKGDGKAKKRKEKTSKRKGKGVTITETNNPVAEDL